MMCWMSVELLLKKGFKIRRVNPVNLNCMKVVLGGAVKGTLGTDEPREERDN